MEMDRDSFGRFKMGGRPGPGRPRADGEDQDVDEPPFFDDEGRISIMYMSLPFEGSRVSGSQQKDVDALDEIGARFRAALGELLDYKDGRVEVVVFVKNGSIDLSQCLVQAVGLQKKDGL